MEQSKRQQALQNLGLTLFGVFMLYVAYMTAQGTILNYIGFADPLNEMGFCFTSFILGIMCIYVGIPQRHWNKLNPFKK